MRSIHDASSRARLLALAFTAWAYAGIVQADPPPPWSGEPQVDRPYHRAPYHAWRGYCNHEQFAGAVGGALGGYLGSRVAEEEGRVAATAAGAFFGYLIGSRIGRSMDESDPSCGIGSIERTHRRNVPEDVTYPSVIW